MFTCVCLRRCQWLFPHLCVFRYVCICVYFAFMCGGVYGCLWNVFVHVCASAGSIMICTHRPIMAGVDIDTTNMLIVSSSAYFQHMH